MATNHHWRIEIIANHSIEDDLLDHLKNRNTGTHYTLVPTVDGLGSSGGRMGDGVWPEENFILVMYADEEESQRIIEAVREVKNLFPDEGIKAWRTKAENLV